jgi:hypothetical protein
LNKKEVVWLIIRLIGLWLVWEAIESTAPLITLITTGPVSNYLLTFVLAILRSLARIIFYLAVGIYFLKGGGVIFDLLNHEAKPEK